MKNRRWRIGTVLFALIFALMALGGCGGGSDNKKPAPGPQQPGPQQPGPQPQGKALEKWNGTWKSFDDFVDEDAMKPVYAEVAKHAPGYTAKGVEGFFEEMYHTDFDSLKVSGDTVTFMDSKGVAKGTLTYVSKGTQKRKFEMAGQTMEIEWHLFEAPIVSGATNKAMHADGDFDPSKSCKYLALFPVHQDRPDSFKHWHMRYGSKSLETLMDDPDLAGWWPTLCAPDTKVADIAKDQLGEAKLLATMLPMPMAPWKGEWISAYELHRSDKMLPAYEKIAQEAKKLGKNYTAEDVKNHYHKMFETPFDRVSVVDGLNVQFKKADGTVVATSPYRIDGLDDGWWIWIEGTVAGYKTVVATHPHGQGTSRHWHMRYADDKTPDQLRGLKGWTPTFYDPKVTTLDLYVKGYVDTAERKAKGLPDKK